MGQLSCTSVPQEPSSSHFYSPSGPVDPYPSLMGLGIHFFAMLYSALWCTLYFTLGVYMLYKTSTSPRSFNAESSPGSETEAFHFGQTWP